MEVIRIDNFTYDITINANNYTNNQSNETYLLEGNIGGFPYLLDYLAIYIPYTVFSFLGVIFGLIGNMFVFGAIFCCKELRNNPTCILILNLSIADFIISIIVNSFTIVTAYVGKRFFDENPALCKLIGAICLISCATSLVTMALLAFNRYVCIFYHVAYIKIFSISKTICYCVATWVIGIAIDIPNFFGFGDHVYDKKALACVFDRLKVAYTATFCIVCIYIPAAFILYCYCRIFFYSYTIRKKIADKAKTLKNNADAIKMAKSLFCAFFIFCICWIPVSIVLMVGVDDRLPMSAHAFTNLPAHLNSVVNPVSYAIFNSKMREGYKIFLNRMFLNKIYKSKRRNKSKADQTQTQNTTTQDTQTTKSVEKLVLYFKFF